MVAKTWVTSSLLLFVFIFQLKILVSNCWVKSPPVITKQPPADELLFQVAQRQDEVDKPFFMECEADGEPAPTYLWMKNGQEFNWQDFSDRISQHSASGTLVVTSPKNEDIGQYQCFASNIWGTATSNSVFLRKAELSLFQQEETSTLFVDEGSPFNVTCNSPGGSPKPKVHWMLQNADGVLKNINDSRITVDPEGTLWFSNVTKEDKSFEFLYSCVAYSSFTTEYRLGNRVYLSVTPTNDGPSIKNKRAPIMQYVSNDTFALRGSSVSLWCIAGGTPLPKIKWRKEGGQLPSDVEYDNYGKTLRIENLDFDDEGNYVCEASNGIGSPVSHSVKLAIFAMPYFTIEPEVQQKAEGEMVEFRCEATGRPDPDITWIYNGKPLEDAEPNPRRKVIGNRVIIDDIEKSDTANYGCNATNKFGYVYKDVYVNVGALPPDITTKPMSMVTTDGKTVTLTCNAEGVPKPKFKWTKNDQEISGNRFKVQEYGNLIIQDVTFEDAGIFTCFAQNRLGSENASATLVVKEHTKITDKPDDYEITEMIFSKLSFKDLQAVRLVSIKWCLFGTAEMIKICQLDLSLLPDVNINEKGKYIMPDINLNTKLMTRIKSSQSPRPSHLESENDNICYMPRLMAFLKKYGKHVEQIILDGNCCENMDYYFCNLNNIRKILTKYCLDLNYLRIKGFEKLQIVSVPSPAFLQPLKLKTLHLEFIDDDDDADINLIGGDFKIFLDELIVAAIHLENLNIKCNYIPDLSKNLKLKKLWIEWEPGHRVPLKKFRALVGPIANSLDELLFYPVSVNCEVDKDQIYDFPAFSNLKVMHIMGIDRVDQLKVKFIENLLMSKCPNVKKLRLPAAIVTDMNQYFAYSQNHTKINNFTIELIKDKTTLQRLLPVFPNLTALRIFVNVECFYTFLDICSTAKQLRSLQIMIVNDIDVSNFAVNLLWCFENTSLLSSIQDLKIEMNCQCTDDLTNFSIHQLEKALLLTKQLTRFELVNFQVAAGSGVTLRCIATTDPTLYLQIHWLKDDEEIDFDIEKRYAKLEDSMTIEKTAEVDSGEYTCLAKTDYDNATASATLTVDDVSKRPNVTAIICSRREATIQWKPIGKSRSPILNYIVEYNTSFTPDKWEVVSKDVPANDNSLMISMSPWTNYTYRVIARNKIGLSEPSLPSKACETLADVPFKNPTNVKGDGTSPTNLVISWTPMQEIDHNGPNFKYEVQWKEDNSDSSDDKWNVQEVTDWRQTEVVIEDQPTYKPYLIKVKAKNDMGDSTARLTEIRGYSGQDVPTESPENFRLGKKVEDQVAILNWSPVSPESLRGKFEGYTIETWTDKTEDEKRKLFYKNDVTNAVVDNLVPFTNNYFVVRAYNGQHTGPPSRTLSVSIPAGRSGPIETLEGYPLGSNALYLQWEKPQQPNGNLTGYSVYFQKIEDADNLGLLMQRAPDMQDPETTTAKLAGLDPGQKYRVQVKAINVKGIGTPGKYIELSTENARLGTTLEKPTFTWIYNKTDKDSAAIRFHWIPNFNGPGRPGSNFYAQCRIDGESQQYFTDLEMYENFITLFELDPQATYSCHVVSVDGNLSSMSDEQIIGPNVGGVAEASTARSSSGWFIGFIVITAFVLLVVILVCIVKRNRGGKYAVYEREIAHGRLDYDDRFREHSQPKEHPERLSLSSEFKEQSDSYSVAEYDEEGKFTEDGSFIGEYGVNKKKYMNK